MSVSHAFKSNSYVGNILGSLMAIFKPMPLKVGVIVWVLWNCYENNAPPLLRWIQV